MRIKIKILCVTLLMTILAIFEFKVTAFAKLEKQPAIELEKINEQVMIILQKVGVDLKL